MPKNKDLKKLVRDRAKKTGESYTTARANTLTGIENGSQTRPESEIPKSQQLGRKDTTIFLTNASGHPTNAAEISYSLYEISAGTENLLESGCIPVNPSVGEYYANSFVSVGSYRIRWAIREIVGGQLQEVAQEFGTRPKQIRSKYIEHIERKAEETKFWFSWPPGPKKVKNPLTEEQVEEKQLGVEAMDLSIQEYLEQEVGSEISLPDNVELDMLWPKAPDLSSTKETGAMTLLSNYSQWVSRTSLLERKLAEADAEKEVLFDAAFKGIIPGSDAGDARVMHLYLKDLLTDRKVFTRNIRWADYLKMTPVEAWRPALDWLRGKDGLVERIKDNDSFWG
jgi:hypothetical protein